MAHFAQLDENNIVLQVIVVGNEYLLDENNVEQESLGVQFCVDTFGGGNWKQTSYNHSFRKQYAQVDGSYDPINNVFISPKPYPSWVLNSNFDWVAPIPDPSEVLGDYVWSEETLSWVENGAWASALSQTEMRG
jgi:hypothetical protein